jgi:hypothetical protein
LKRVSRSEKSLAPTEGAPGESGGTRGGEEDRHTLIHHDGDQEAFARMFGFANGAQACEARETLGGA